jgi:hypothetical protein
LIASLYILARLRVGQRPGWLPWMAPGVGTAASRAANIGIGGHDLVGWLLAGWPAVALLVSIKLLFGMFKQEDAVPAVRDDQQTSADPADVPKSVHGTVLAGDRAATLDARSVTDLLPRRADGPDRAGELTWSEERGMLYHYRTKDGSEVDAVIETPDGRVIGVEVKARATVCTEDLRGLRGLANALGERFIAGYVLYTGQQTLPFGDKIRAVPLDALWRLAQ